MVLLLLCFIVFLAMGMPIAFVIGISGFAFFMSQPMLPFESAVQMVVLQSQSFAFLAVPFFIFAGNLMNVSGITDRLLSLARLLTRRMYGGTAQVSVVMSTLMGGVSGSATADAVMETRILGPEMIRLGYKKGYICAVNCTTALITATIPPSLGFIIFGFVGEVSIGRLFAGGIIPGILMMFFLMATTTITSRVNKYDPPQAEAPKLTFREIGEHLKESIWALLFPIILIVGIRFGIFTPSESGAFAVVYAILIGKFVYKELSWEKFRAALVMSFKDNGAIMLIIAMSGAFSYAITWVRLPIALSGFIFGITSNPQALVLIMLGFLFVTGMFVDSNVIFLLLTPIFLPMVKSLGFDPVHFGVLMATVVTLGVMTPPIGAAMYTVCGIIDCPPEEYTKESIPFMAAILLELAILVFFPDVVTFIPNLIFGK
ncbi:MAG: C4-dicarboxylate ABC transporter [Treponema sp. GWB1_62_6]|nr:MAG: C4-dicarboxylate ABC transporter [Treponema sp. GWA1_62_8]OHE67616.1 MAG: C4-dicarboxylate ABC transporter [Treponema sp. GWC1_61_84]OHE70012.1 MAG: C4-dicarboxylate ABC transporter [Treponema sp. GWB1_62_6]OHE70529.1 MAG: C4-dicarboxylate ABC transporter [Treponema sp. RIFOXYC1_FULL_61_9]HCM25836.1 C4-dicarboxylate ABC transporter [Treponema sp.]